MIENKTFNLSFLKVASNIKETQWNDSKTFLDIVSNVLVCFDHFCMHSLANFISQLELARKKNEIFASFFIFV